MNKRQVKFVCAVILSLLLIAIANTFDGFTNTYWDRQLIMAGVITFGCFLFVYHIVFKPEPNDLP